jgi:hypothetical protein
MRALHILLPADVYVVPNGELCYGTRFMIDDIKFLLCQIKSTIHFKVLQFSSFPLSTHLVKGFEIQIAQEMSVLVFWGAMPCSVATQETNTDVLYKGFVT